MLTPGSRIGPYEITGSLGAGGMGEVFRAHDSRLKRDVAVKVLPEAFAGDAERLARFSREAQALAALNHPNIASIYGVEEAGDIRALVMELVEGGTLADRLQANAMMVDEALPVARQVADALEAAHEKGIIHRDLKPANIALTPDGHVKVLDFGLAKALEPENAPDVSNSPTLSMRATQAGLILGTAAYMSPEQARGRAADRRADVWAFGCVVYEMLTGKRAFDGEDVTDIIAAVVRSEPDWNALPPDLSPQLRLLITRCLVKDRKQRLSDIAVAKFLLNETLPAAPASAAVTAPVVLRPSRKRLAAVAIAALAIGVAVTSLGWWAASRVWQQPVPTMRFAVGLAQPLTAQGVDRDIAISPDGRHLVYRSGVENGILLVRPIDQLEAQQLNSTTGARQPFFSPDGRWIGFFSGQELKKVSITGGPAITICRFNGPPRLASWSEDVILFASVDPSAGIQRVSAAGGEPTTLTTPDAAKGEADHFYPSALPGGRGWLYTITRTGGQVGGFQIAVFDSRTSQSKIIIPGGSDATYVNSGHLIYAAAGTLRAVRFDLDRLEVTSDPVPVVEQVSASGPGMANYAVSATGTLVFVQGVGAASVQRSLVWVNRQGREEPIKAPPRAYVMPRISPDGTRIAVDIRDQEQDIWVWDIARQGPLTRLTFDASPDQYPTWTPDSRAIVFASARAGFPNVYRQAADGTGSVERLTDSPQAQFPHSITPDGTRLLLFQAGIKTGNDVVSLKLTPAKAGDSSGSTAQADPVVQTTFIEWLAEVSPDGRWLAYASNESGQFEVVVRPFPNVDGGRWQVSHGGASKPAWARNGREIFYMDPTGRLMGVPVQASGTTFNVTGTPAAIFDTRYYLGAPPNRTYDVSPDGQQFLMIKEIGAGDQPAAPNLVVVLNWFEELKQRTK